MPPMATGDRLLIATCDFLPQLGGVSIAAHHIANAFADLGVRTSVLGPAPAQAEGFPARYEIIADQDAKPRRREGKTWPAEQRRILSVLAREHARAPIARILLMHPFYYGPPAHVIRDRHGVPVSVMFHGYELASQLRRRAWAHSVRCAVRGRGPTLRDITLEFLNDADDILVNSRHVGDIVRRVGGVVPPAVIGCGLDLEEYKTQTATPRDKAEIRKRFNLPETGQIVGTLCRLAPHKNVDMLLRTLALRPALHAVVIGDGPDVARLESLALALDIADRVHGFGQVSEADKWDLLSALDAFCLLSRQGANGQVEGFGIALLEASAVGVPVICTRSGGMVDVVEDQVTGLIVDVDEDDALVRAIERVVTEPGLRRRLTAQAREQIETKYNWTTIAADLIERWDLPARNRTALAAAPRRAPLTCPICAGGTFVSYNGRAGAQCIDCKSLERTRLLWLVLEHAGVIKSGAKVLHIAPEAALMPALAERLGEGYQPVDIDPALYPGAKPAVKKLDLCADLADIAEGTFDVIIHNHVLEHVACGVEDVLSELTRVLAPGGSQFLSVPFRGKQTREDLSETLSESDRVREFGQADHMRLFGSDDFPALLSRLWGVDNPVYALDGVLTEAEARTYAIPPETLTRVGGHTIFHQRKSVAEAVVEMDAAS